MSINWLVFIGVIIVQYVIGALWYSLIFGKQWILINHPEGRPSKKEMEEMGKTATPYYVIQLVLTTVTAYFQWVFVMENMDKWLETSLLIWVGFLVPMIIQTIIWSDPNNKRKLTQVGIMALHSLVTVILAGWAFAMFG